MRRSRVCRVKRLIRDALVLGATFGPAHRLSNMVLLKLRSVETNGSLGATVSMLCEKMTSVIDDADHFDGVYGPRYFGHRRDPGGRGGLSGYALCTTDTSKSDLSAYIIWRLFEIGNILEIGCSSGFLVEALAKAGYEVRGVDYSRYALRHATPAALGKISQGDLTKSLQFGDSSFDLVVLLETLEHLAPEAVPGALREVRRLGWGFVYATIP